MPPPRIISLGGGVQSSALLGLAGEGRVDAAVFANVGDDSEWPETLPWVRDILMPYGEEHGIPVIEVQKVLRDGTPVTLLTHLTNAKRSIDIPIRMAPGGAPGRRNCTKEFKIKVIDKWLRANGATKEEPATVLIGFSIDEVGRLKNGRWSDVSVAEHPLIFDQRWSRDACQSYNIRTFGGPAPKSSCTFCPFRKVSNFQEMRRDHPDRFQQAVDVEDMLNVRREELGKDEAYITRLCVPLRDLPEAQTALFDGDGPESCDEGACFT